MPFIPANYDQSQIASGTKQDFFKIADGENKIRILSPQLAFGFEYWTNDNKPKRVKNRPAITPADIRLNDEGKPDPVRHIWVMQVWDYSDSKVKLWSFHQASIMTPLASYFNDEDWGDPIDYDLKISKKGSGLNTKYSIVPSPKKPLTAEQVDAVENQVSTFDLNSLFAEPDQLPQQLQAPKPTGFSETSGTVHEAKQWALNQGIDAEMIDNLLADIEDMANEKKVLGEPPMSGNERRKIFINSVNAHLVANPDIKPVASEADSIPF